MACSLVSAWFLPQSKHASEVNSELSHFKQVSVCLFFFSLTVDDKLAACPRCQPAFTLHQLRGTKADQTRLTGSKQVLKEED